MLDARYCVSYYIGGEACTQVAMYWPGLIDLGHWVIFGQPRVIR